MQSTNVRQIKAALVNQAFHGTTQVSCQWGQVVAVSRWKGQLRVMIWGWRRWYPVESVRIEGVGSQLLQEGTRSCPPVLPMARQRVRDSHHTRRALAKRHGLGWRRGT
jgi:hypothetical protein